MRHTKNPLWLWRIYVVLLIFIGLSLFFFSKHSSPTFHIPLDPPILRTYHTTDIYDESAHIPAHIKDILFSSSDTDLIPFSCSPHFVRNWESYFFLQQKKDNKFTVSLDHDEVIAFLSEKEKALPYLPGSEKRFLKGRICESSQGLRWFEYYRGIQPQFYDDFIALGRDIETYLFLSTHHVVDLTTTHQGPYLHCVPLHLTQTNHLYYQCTQTTPDTSTTWWYDIDMPSGQQTHISTCTYTYKPKREELCI